MAFARPGATSRTSATGNQKRRKYRPAMVSGPVRASSATSFASLTWLSFVEVVMARRLYGPGGSGATDAVRIAGQPASLPGHLGGGRIHYLCVARLLKRFQRLAAHRRVDVQVRDADDRAELLEHKETGAVVDERSPVPAFNHGAFDAV